MHGPAVPNLMGAHIRLMALSLLKSVTFGAVPPFYDSGGAVDGSEEQLQGLSEGADLLHSEAGGNLAGPVR